MQEILTVLGFSLLTVAFLTWIWAICQDKEPATIPRPHPPPPPPPSNPYYLDGEQEGISICHVLSQWVTYMMAISVSSLVLLPMQQTRTYNLTSCKTRTKTTKHGFLITEYGVRN